MTIWWVRVGEGLGEAEDEEMTTHRRALVKVEYVRRWWWRRRVNGGTRRRRGD